MVARSLSRAIPIIAVVSLVSWLYANTIKEFIAIWVSDGNYAHGMIVAPVAAYLAYAKRRTLATIPIQPSVSGNALLATGLAVLILGRWADIAFLGGISLVLVIAGIVWTFFGLRMLKELAFPVAFLVFMCPMPDFFVEKIGAPLQRASCGYATMLGGLFGIDVRSEGVMFLTNGMTFSVDVPCSGIRAINAMAAFTAVLAYLTSASLPRRILIFALALPVAFAGNVLRVFGVVAAANVGIAKVEVMRFHDISGPLVFLLAVGLVLLVKRRLECSFQKDTCPV